MQANSEWFCTKSVDRLQAGFESLEDWEDESFWDESFEPYGSEAVWWPDFTPYEEYQWFDNQFSRGKLYFTRFVNEYSDAELWGADGEVSFADIQQGEAPAYLKASLSSFAEFPDMVKAAFPGTEELNDSGIYNVRFFIRGKPWIVTVDNYLAFMDVDSDEEPELVFGAMGQGNAAWGIIMEKAWAKVKGNYMNAEFDLSANSIRALTGAPVFDYYSDEFEVSDEAMDEMWELLLEAEKQNYLMSASSNGMAGDHLVNGCGIKMAHAYSIISAFIMVDAEGNDIRAMLMRNPAGNNGYNWRWSGEDPKWSDGLAAQVPFDFDPRE